MKRVGEREVADYADLARLAHVSRARITQIMNLLLRAADTQEATLSRFSADGPRGSIRERQVRRIRAVPNWRKQRAARENAVDSRKAARVILQPSNS